MKTANKPPVGNEEKGTSFTVFVDGAGSRPDGNGSGFAWVCTTTQEKRIERVSGLTNNQAEYRGLIAALSELPDRARVEILSDSQLLCCQFSGKYKVKDPNLAGLLTGPKRTQIAEIRNLASTLIQ